MDIGSFVVDADGVRWADDLGMQDYNSLESKGVDLWSRGQDAARWNVFRLSAAAHSVLTVNGERQRFDSKASIVKSTATETTVDLSETYQGQLSGAKRTVQLGQDRTVTICDEFTSSNPNSVRWAMLTRAEVKIGKNGRATLTRDGRELELRVLAPANAVLKIYPTDPPPNPTDAPNPGTRLIGFEIKTEAGARQQIRVQLVPASARK